MAVKYFCDRCGKEAKELYSISVYSTYKRVRLTEVPVVYYYGLCKKCTIELLGKIKKVMND